MRDLFFRLFSSFIGNRDDLNRLNAVDPTAGPMSDPATGRHLRLVTLPQFQEPAIADNTSTEPPTTDTKDSLDDFDDWFQGLAFLNDDNATTGNDETSQSPEPQWYSDQAYNFNPAAVAGHGPLEGPALMDALFGEKLSDTLYALVISLAPNYSEARVRVRSGFETFVSAGPLAYGHYIDEITIYATSQVQEHGAEVCTTSANALTLHQRVVHSREVYHH